MSHVTRTSLSRLKVNLQGAGRIVAAFGCASITIIILRVLEKKVFRVLEKKVFHCYFLDNLGKTYNFFLRHSILMFTC